MRETDLYKRRDAKLRNMFNDVAEEYEEYRFSYPDRLYNDIWNYCNTGENALEIGIGTGKATNPFLKRGFRITAVEPCVNMLEIASKKFSNENIKYINSTFEEGFFDEQYDLIYAASAFQWINDNNRVHKVYGLLNVGGTFARFKTMNVIISEKSEVNRILLDIYQKNIPDYLPNDKESKHMKDCEYLDAGFKDMTREVYYIDRNYSINNYLKLINTYTEYVVLPENLRREFEHEIKEKIGDSDFVLTQKCTLFMARR